ncbi:MAG: DedA family protein [Limnochordia bacterium]|jgi:membrane protein YqaA with SNARE-associated domain|nr:DedA family protein [Limnochordia bacterium]MDD2629999.1 DedA family protein [Limnochordia bacterium]MDD4517405.1 DedA family protein [Limnochordia bacterium]
MLSVFSDGWKRLVSLIMSAVNPVTLFFVAAVEAIFFPLPPETLLIPLTLAKPRFGLLFALICTTGSLLGASVGYWLGRQGGRPLAVRLAGKEKVQLVERLFAKYGVWAVGIAGFTPVPYQVCVITSGIFVYPFKWFILISALTRGTRYSLIALLLMKYGRQMVDFINQYFELVTVGVVVILILAYFAYRRFHAWAKRV